MITASTARWFCAASATSLALAPPVSAAPHDWDRASSIVRTGVVSLSVGAPIANGDWSGLKQDALALGVTAAITGGLKRVTHEQRPDGSDDSSFPSGHTSISFAAAAGLEQRYGWKFGIPAHLLAAFVGIARVRAEKHYFHDVVIGAALGEAVGLLLVNQRRHHQSSPIGAQFSMAF